MIDLITGKSDNLTDCSEAFLNRLPVALAVLRLGSEGTSVNANEAFAALFGCPCEHIRDNICTDVLSFIYIDDIPMVTSTIRKLVSGDGDHAEIVFRIKHRDGKIHWISALINADWSGIKSCELFIFCTDISESKLQEQRLREDKERYKISGELCFPPDTTKVAIWEYDHASRTIIQSENSRRINGYSKLVTDVPHSLIERGYVHPDSAEAFLKMYEKLSAGAEKADGIYKVRCCSTGSYRYKHTYYTNLFDAEGKPYRAIGMSKDITDKYEAWLNCERELQLRQIMAPNVLLSALFDVTLWTVVRVQYGGTMQDTMPKDVSSDSIIGASVRELSDEEDIRSCLSSHSANKLVSLYENGQDSYSLEYMRSVGNGLFHWVREEANLMPDIGSGHLMMFVCIRDIDEEKKRLEELSKAAEMDSMTEFYNHDTTMKHISTYLRTEGRTGIHALFMIDIDNFKYVNDKLGHLGGDEIIAKVAVAIRGVFRSSDILGRIGGDEFLVLMKNISDMQLVHRKASELIDALQFVCTADDVYLHLSSSVGITTYKADEKDLDKLYSEADTALYQAKGNGKTRYAVFTPSVSENPEEDTQNRNGQASTVQLCTLLEYLEGGVIIAEVTDKIKFVYISPSFFKTSGRSPKEFGVMGEGMLSFVYPDDVDGLKAALFESAQKGSLADVTYRSFNYDDSIGWRHLRIARLPERDDGICRLIGIVTDITELKRSTAQFEALFDYSPVGIGMFELRDETAHAILTNKTYEKMLSCAPDEVKLKIGENAFALVDSRDLPHLKAEIRDALAAGRPFDTAYRCSKVVGGNSVIHIRGVKLYEQNGNPVVIAIYNFETHETAFERQRYQVNTA